MSIHIVWRGKRRKKILKFSKRGENLRIEEFACLEVKFQKACELRVISREAYEDRVKFRNLSLDKHRVVIKRCVSERK
jgi:hypothetical protein